MTFLSIELQDFEAIFKETYREFKKSKTSLGQ